MTDSDVSAQDELYEEASAEFGEALSRLGRAYEMDAEKRRDLLQEIHLALWRSLKGFDRRCSLRTWVYRVAHNAAANYVNRQKRARGEGLVSLEELEAVAAPATTDGLAMDRVMVLIQRLKPLDRQVIVLWLEGMEGAEIGEMTGLSAGSVATRVHRIRGLLSKQYREGVRAQ